MPTTPIAAVGPAGRVATRAPRASLLFYALGFAAPVLLHDAAHHTRHVLAFPCH
jgi:cobalt transporter subunit CbtB